MLVVDAFGAADVELSLAEITKRTGMPKPTVRRLMRELVAAGLLEESDYGVRLGLRLLELGSMVQQHSRLRTVALPYMRELGAATRQTVHLGILDDLEVLYLEKLSGDASPAMPSRVGGRMPAYCTGLGKAMLAQSSQHEVASALRRPMTRLTPRTQTQPGHLLREFDRVRARGAAFDQEESVQGVVCCAAPIVDANGTLVGGLSLTGWSVRLNVAKLASTVHESARAIGARLTRPALTPA